MEGSGKLGGIVRVWTSLDEIVLLGTINELLRGFPLDHKGNRIGLFGR